MNAAITTLIAVAGTLLGSLVTHVFQQRSLLRTERQAQRLKLREERMAAFIEFAGLITEYRHAQHTRWRQVQRDDKSSVAFKEAQESSRRLRVAISRATYNLQLLTDDERLLRLAESAFDITGGIHLAADDRSRQAEGERCKEVLQQFIQVAAETVRIIGEPKRSGLE